MVLIDLGEFLEDEAVPVTYTPPETGTYNADGDWVPNAVSPVAATAVVQPARGRQLLDLPEGTRTEARFFLWTRLSIALGGIVNYGGANYKVVFTWPRPEGGFTRAAIGLMAS